MNVKKHMGLLIGGAVVLLFLLGSLAMLYGKWSTYEEQRNNLNSLTQRLFRLYARDPYPSEENVEKEKENLDSVRESLETLNTALRQGQVEPQQMGAAEFMTLLEKTLINLNKKMALAEVEVPQGFLYSFERYAKDGSPPRDAHISRLVQQLKIVDNLCNIMIDSKISELTSIKRDEFESRENTASSTASTSRSRGRSSPRSSPGGKPEARTGVIGQDDLYAVMKFKVTFRARESAMFEVIDKLAADPMFCVITYLEMANQRQGLSGISLKTPTPDETGEGTVKTVREIVIGREEVDVKLHVDVYRFAPVRDLSEKSRTGKKR